MPDDPSHRGDDVRNPRDQMAHPSNEAKRLVRLNCGATGADIGHGYGLYVSAQDNDLDIDRINTSPDADPPWLDTPWPGSSNVALARMILNSLNWHGALKP